MKLQSSVYWNNAEASTTQSSLFTLTTSLFDIHEVTKLLVRDLQTGQQVSDLSAWKSSSASCFQWTG